MSKNVPAGGTIGLDGSLTLKTRLEPLVVKDDEGRESSLDAETYKLYARNFPSQLKAAWLGRMFEYGRTGRFTVLGLRMQGRRRLVIVETDRGERAFKLAVFPSVMEKAARVRG